MADVLTLKSESEDVSKGYRSEVFGLLGLSFWFFLFVVVVVVFND